MSDEEMRIAIAGAVRGGVFLRPTGSSGWNYRSSIVGRLLPCVNGDPLQDLNAMHEAENALSADEHGIFSRRLQEVTKARWKISGSTAEGVLYFNIIHATARQRAEAFLRTKGLWKE